MMIKRSEIEFRYEKVTKIRLESRLHRSEDTGIPKISVKGDCKGETPD